MGDRLCAIRGPLIEFGFERSARCVSETFCLGIRRNDMSCTARQANRQGREFAMMSGWGIGAGLMFLWMALFWIGVVFLVVWSIRQFTRNDRPVGNRALEILEERYARGEIDHDEFEFRRRDLRG